MAKKKFNWYAVRKGRKPDIYRNWYGIGEAFEQVDGFTKAEYKGFYTRPEAEDYMHGNNAVLKHYNNLVDKLAGGDNSVMEEAIRIGKQLRESSVDDGKAPWED